MHCTSRHFLRTPGFYTWPLVFKGKVLFAISHIQLVQNEPARNDAVINVRFQHVLSVHKRAVILTEITTCGGNCIP